MKKNTLRMCFFLMMCVVPLFAVNAQTNEGGVDAEMAERVLLGQPEVQIDQIPSLFFTSGEEVLVASVRNGITARVSDESDLGTRNQEDEYRPNRGPRELALGGIVYTSSSDWTVWINGERITPKRLPPEVLDIKVSKDHINLKWFDAYTNQIFPIKLKPHQRFNIDTRIFLPG